MRQTPPLIAFWLVMGLQFSTANVLAQPSDEPPKPTLVDVCRINPDLPVCKIKD